MKKTIPIPTEIEITHLEVVLPIHYGEEDIPNDFPLRDGDEWKAKINIDTGEIEGWPKGRTGKIDMNVCDSGTYTLWGPSGIVGNVIHSYVPRDIGIGGGDYAEIEIDENGMIKNWPSEPDVQAFLEEP